MTWSSTVSPCEFRSKPLLHSDCTNSPPSQITWEMKTPKSENTRVLNFFNSLSVLATKIECCPHYNLQERRHRFSVVFLVVVRRQSRVNCIAMQLVFNGFTISRASRLASYRRRRRRQQRRNTWPIMLYCCHCSMMLLLNVNERKTKNLSPEPAYAYAHKHRKWDTASATAVARHNITYNYINILLHTRRGHGLKKRSHSRQSKCI